MGRIQVHTKTIYMDWIATPAAAAVYGHWKAEDHYKGCLPPIFYLVNLAFCYSLEKEAEEERKAAKVAKDN